MKPEICIIAAVSENGIIGKEGQIPWHIPEDLKRFRELTLGHLLIMGRKTFESIGKPLPGRVNIVVSRNILPGCGDLCICHHSIETAMLAAPSFDKERVFIIGGGSIYEQTISLAGRLFITVVKGNFDGDTHFPDYSKFNRIANEENGQSGGYQYKFLEFEKGLKDES